MSRACVCCGGDTYSLARNNYLCRACWKVWCVPDIPDWLRYLQNHARYESRHDLLERTRRNHLDYPETQLLRNVSIPDCELDVIAEMYRQDAA